MWRSLPFIWRIDAWRLLATGQGNAKVLQRLSPSTCKEQGKGITSTRGENVFTIIKFCNFDITTIESSEESLVSLESQMSSTLLVHAPLRIYAWRRRRKKSNSKLSPRVGKKGPFCISRKDVAREHPFQWRNPRSLTRDSSSAKNYMRPILSPYTASQSRGMALSRRPISPGDDNSDSKCPKKTNFSTLDHAVRFLARIVRDAPGWKWVAVYGTRNDNAQP